MNQRTYHGVSLVRVKHTLLLNCSNLETILRRFGNHSEAICVLEIETNEEIFPVSQIVSKEITSVSINNLISNRSPANPSPFRSIFPIWFIFNKHANETHLFSLLVDTLSENKVKRRDSIKYDDVVAKILQTYQMDGTTFEIAGKKLKLKRNDFKLIFGIACGQKKMNLAYGRKNEVAMVQRRKITESRMTSASIQKLITKLLRSNNNEDVEDVVRLVCPLVCLLLLYPDTGTTIG
ncbi:unnamed protein product [Camellia sinensis]